MIKAIIFDYGGVIGNNPSSYIYKKVSKEFNVSVSAIEAEFSKFIYPLILGRLSPEVFWKKIVKNLTIEDYGKFKKVWLDEFRAKTTMDERVLSILRKLKPRYKLYLLSNNTIFYQTKSITATLVTIFDDRINSFNVRMRKPEQLIYDYTLKRIEFKPSECLIIDDSEKN
ncbi:HAD-IA family hydrolase, partial [bacterium]|nr:HAD-IA family hydrolase [bacterium]